MKTGKFAHLSFFAISLLMGLLTLTIELTELERTIDTEPFLGLGLVFLVFAGLLDARAWKVRS